MALFPWPCTTPERFHEDLGLIRVLPVIPSEIYFHIFDHLAPPARRLSRRKLLIFASLSRVCKLFANICLPRIFESIKFSRTGYSGGLEPGLQVESPMLADAVEPFLQVYSFSRATTLVSHIAAKQPLALALAQCVRTCHFQNDIPDSNTDEVWAVTPREYLTKLSYMSNVRRLEFSSSLVDESCWLVIASLQSLGELSFECCEFLHPLMGDTLEDRVKIKISCLDVIHCIQPSPSPLISVDAPYLRRLTMYGVESDILIIGHILERAAHSIEVLSFCMDDLTGSVNSAFQHTSDTLTWTNLPHLRSLTIDVYHISTVANSEILSAALDGVRCLTGLRSLRLVTRCYPSPPKMSTSEIQAILHDKLGPWSCLACVHASGRTFRLVDGKWSESS